MKTWRRKKINHPGPAVRFTRAKLVRAVRDWWGTYGRPPTMRELAPVLGAKHASTLLKPLEEAIQKGDLEVELKAGRVWYVWPEGLREPIKKMSARWPIS